MDTKLRRYAARSMEPRQGIGQEIERVSYCEKVKVALLARKAERLDAMTDSLTAAIQVAVAALGPTDTAVNGAGGAQSSTRGLVRAYEDLTRPDWRAISEFNVLFVGWVARALAPGMSAVGLRPLRTIFSKSGFQTGRVSIENGSAKGALNALTKGLAMAYAHKGMLVTTVPSSHIETPILGDVLAQKDCAAAFPGDEVTARYWQRFTPEYQRRSTISARVCHRDRRDSCIRGGRLHARHQAARRSRLGHVASREVKR